MKVSEAIEAYLAHQRLRGLLPGTLRTTRHALSTVLAMALGDDIKDLAADGVGAALRTILSRRVSRTSKKPLTKCTQELTLSLTRAFLAWAIGKGWLASNPLDQQVPAPAPPAPPIAPKHLGELIRNLRTGAGLSRHVFGDAVKLSEPDLKSIELRKRLPSKEQLDRIAAHPAMADLLAKAAREGVKVELEPEMHPDPSGFRRVEGDKP